MNLQRASLAIAVTAALAAVTTTVPGAAATSSTPAPDRPSLHLLGPTTARAGQVVHLELEAEHAPRLAALEATLRYDDRAVAIDRVVWAGSMPSGAALHGLETADAPNRTTLGAWSCTAAPCGGARHETTGHVASIDVVALRTGLVNVRLSNIELLAPDGSMLGSSAPSSHRAQATPTTPREPAGLAAEWLLAANRGTECGADVYADVNGDRCLTIADVQFEAGHVNAPDPSVGRARRAAPNTTATFVVNSTGDGGDAHIDGVCQTSTPGVCTLRAALQEANAASSAAEIDFNISGSGTQTIAPQSALPPLTNPNGTTINGFTQPGSSANTDPLVDNATYGIDLAGKGPGHFPGFVVESSHNTIEGFDIHAFSQEVNLDTSNSNYNTVVGDMLGLTPTGAYDPTHGTVNDASCLVLQNGASHNQIGAPGNATRNVVSGCDFKGIASYNWPTSWNTIQNNIVGLDPTGTQRRATVSHGIDITRGSEHTMIGGTGSEERNVVSGNAQAGIEVAHEASTQLNSVIGNYVGTDPTGNSAPPFAANSYWGVHLEGHGDCGSQPCPPDQNHETVEYNVIVDSGRGGVMVDKGTNNSLIAYNDIGVTANGTAAGNKMFGLNINGGAFQITVAHNEIAHNDAGVQIEPDQVLDPNHILTTTNRNTITQNSIHDNNQTGTAALGIDLTPFGKVNTTANASSYVNDAIIAPTLSNPQPNSITAATCANCTVEMFVADSAAGVWGSGQTYLTSGQADSTGNAVIALPGGTAGQVVTATATNANGSTSEFAKNVLVPTTGGGDQPPVAQFTQSCNQLTCSFDGSASYDPDGTVVAWAWDFGDGTTASGKTVQHTYANPGTYDVRLTVTDNSGSIGSTLVAISPAKLPPLPAFTWRCVQLSCSFDGHISVDNASHITTYLWDFGDSHSAAGLQVQHQYTSAGIRTVTLVVADAGGATAKVTAPVDANSVTNVGTSVFTFGSHFTVNGAYRPITGDFNGDGNSDILWYAPGSAPDPIWYGTNTGFTHGPALTINGHYEPLVGDFNGDGFADIFWYTTAPNVSSIWYGSSSGFTRGPSFTIYTEYRPAVGDFNGDGNSDIVWDWPTHTSQPVWYGSSSGFTHGHVDLQTRGQPLVGDFNGDHYDDIFWYTGGTGGEHLWLGGPFGLVQAAVAPAIHRAYFPVVGDFNGDGSSDILWYAPGPGTDSVWYGSAAGLQPGPHVSVNGVYEPLAGDFDGDGKGDVFWYATGTNAASVWYGN
jgi:CSLREA domain-containing protein